MIETIAGSNTIGFNSLVDRLSDTEFSLLDLIPQSIVTLSLPVLRHLAWQYDIDIYGMSLAQQSQAIKGAIALHRRRGTKWAVCTALERLSYSNVEVVEGAIGDLTHNGSWVHDGNAVHGGEQELWAVFSVSLISTRGLDTQLVLNAIDAAKNIRSTLSNVSAFLFFHMPYDKIKAVLIFSNHMLLAGEISEGISIDLAALGVSGYFGLEVESDTAIKLFYKASCDNDIPGSVHGGGVLCEHDGSGKKVYPVIIGPFRKIWIYAESLFDNGVISATLHAEAGGAPDTVIVHCDNEEFAEPVTTADGGVTISLSDDYNARTVTGFSLVEAGNVLVEKDLEQPFTKTDIFSVTITITN